MRQLLDGDADIPDEDKEAVYGLLSSYYEKFQETPPSFGDADDDAADDRGASDDNIEEDEDTEDEKEKQFTIALIRALTQNGA